MWIVRASKVSLDPVIQWLRARRLKPISGYVEDTEYNGVRTLCLNLKCKLPVIGRRHIWHVIGTEAVIERAIDDWNLIGIAWGDATCSSVDVTFITRRRYNDA